MNLQNIVWELCYENGKTYCDDTKEIHFDLMNMLIKKHNINPNILTFENCLKLYNLIGEFEMLLNQFGANYEPSERFKNKLKIKYEKITI